MSGTLQQFQLLMQEIGPAVDSDYAVPEGETPAEIWKLTLGDAYTVTFQCLPEKQSFVLSVPLGEAWSPGHYRTLLTYNGLYEETGGARFGLNGDEVVMSIELPLHELSLDDLQNVILNFASTLPAWREFLRSSPGEIEPPPATEPIASGVRV